MQFNKVEICGVNTSKLKTLTEAQKTDLLKRVKKGDRAAREELVKGNLRLVLSVIQRFTNRGENLDDLFQVGCIGLMKSIDNFDISQNVRFSTYAVPMIIGEIRRYLRDNNPIRVSRSLRDTAYKAMQCKERLSNKFQRDPTIEEIAREMQASREDIVMALESVVDPVSLYEPVYSDGGDTIYVMDQIGDKTADSDWLEEITLKEVVSALSEREKRILYLRFFGAHADGGGDGDRHLAGAGLQTRKRRADKDQRTDVSIRAVRPAYTESGTTVFSLRRCIGVELTTIEDLSCKDVINLQDGSRLGNVCDMQIDLCEGCVKALVIFGRPRFFGLFGREEDLLVPWENVKKFGEDTILVDCEPVCRPDRPCRRRKHLFSFLH